MRQVSVATLRLSGGHPALDFTNTVHSRGRNYGPDVLLEYVDLLDWSVRVGVLDPGAAVLLRAVSRPTADAALCRATALREAIYRIFVAGAEATSADLDLLHQTVCAAQAVRRLMPVASGYAWVWPEGDPDGVTHRLAIAATDLLTAPVARRIHVCPGDDCAWLFLDKSRAGRRLWCSEATCGMRNRVRRWRARSHRAADA